MCFRPKSANGFRPNCTTARCSLRGRVALCVALDGRKGGVRRPCSQDDPFLLSLEKASETPARQPIEQLLELFHPLAELLTALAGLPALGAVLVVGFHLLTRLFD